MMSAVATNPVLGTGDDVRRLRAFLEESGFAADGVRRLLRTGDELLSTPFDLPVHARRLALEPSPLATLVELFVLGVTCHANGHSSTSLRLDSTSRPSSA